MEIAISGFLCIYWVYGRRLWELMIDCWKRKKALELNFAQFFLASRRAATFLLHVYYWCSYCLLVRWKNTLWGQKDMYLKAKLNYKIKELFSMVETVIDKRLMLVMCFCHTVSSLRVSEGLVTLKNGSVFVVEILHFDLEFGTQLNLQFDQWENVCNICGYS